jgi:hypothetical protein
MLDTEFNSLRNTHVPTHCHNPRWPLDSRISSPAATRGIKMKRYDSLTKADPQNNNLERPA